MKTTPGTALKRLEWWVDQNGLNLIIVLLVLFFVVVVFWKKIFIVVPAGHCAVLFQPFDNGTQKDLYEEGLHIVAPWNEMTIYNTRLQMTSDTVKAQTKEGMAVSLVFVARYVPKREKLNEIHKYIGPDYVEKIVIPEAVAELRGILSSKTPDKLYTISETEMKSEFLESVKKDIGDSWILFEDVKILRVITSAAYQKAVESHHVLEQKSREYEHRLEQEKREFERKKREAEGIAAFEKISGISYLKYRSIQATEALSVSPNAKVIVVGDGKGVPFVLSEGK